jgi:hypothetical protein
MSGPIHNKGVLIWLGYLGGQYDGQAARTFGQPEL